MDGQKNLSPFFRTLIIVDYDDSEPIIYDPYNVELQTAFSKRRFCLQKIIKTETKNEKDRTSSLFYLRLDDDENMNDTDDGNMRNNWGNDVLKSPKVVRTISVPCPRYNRFFEFFVLTIFIFVNTGLITVAHNPLTKIFEASRTSL